MCFLLVENAFAWRIYNETPLKIRALIGGFDADTSCGSWDSGDGEQIEPGEDEGPNWTTSDCNPSGEQETILFAKIIMEGDGHDLSEDRGYFQCVVAMKAGGSVTVYSQTRTGPAFTDFYLLNPLAKKHYCVSKFGSEEVDRSDYFHTSSSNPDMTPENRDLRFLVTGDTQYWKDRIDNDDNNSGVNETADNIMAKMVDIQATSNKQVRGLVISGDLTQGARDNELRALTNSYQGFVRFGFEGLGNHDVEDVGNDSHPNNIREFVAKKARNTSPTLRPEYNSDSETDPHYSWDWHDVHFVQLNMFPGDEKPESASSGSDLDPRNALSFLSLDLTLYVGDTGRPVVLIHHYGFDSFSVDWWTPAQRVAYWNAIKNYNVIAIFTGHVHESKDSGESSWSRIWSKTSGMESRPDSKTSLPYFIAGAARGPTTCDDLTNACDNGAFLDVTIDQCNVMTITRKDSDGNLTGSGQPAPIDISAPGAANGSCNPPVANITGPATGLEGADITMDGSTSTDPDNEPLEYAWNIDGAPYSAWDSTSTEDFVFPDNDTYTVWLKVRDAFGNEDQTSTNITINNADPNIMSLMGATVNEGDTTNIAGSISDPGAADGPFTLSYDCDSAAIPAVTAMVTQNNEGAFSVPCTYADNPVKGAASGAYSFSATATDKDLGMSSAATVPVTVNNVAPTLTVPGDFTVDEGEAFNLAGSLSDPGINDTLLLSVDWDDGQNAEDFAVAVPSYSVPHSYGNDGTYGVTATVSDDDTGVNSDGLNITVLNLPPEITSVSGTDIEESQASEVTLMFTDAGDSDEFTLQVDWKDGTVEPYPNATKPGPVTSPFVVSHVYADDETPNTSSDDYSIDLTLTDMNDVSSQDSATTIITVTNRNPVVNNLALVQTTIDEGSDASLSFTVDDDGAETSMQYSIGWGDGTSNNEVPVSRGQNVIGITHAYDDDTEGGDGHEISVQAFDDDLGVSLISKVTVNILNVAPSITNVTLSPTAINEADSVTLGFEIVDPGVNDTFDIDVDWGDGSSNDTLSNTSQRVFSSLEHTYQDDDLSGTPTGYYTIVITVTDDDGASSGNSDAVVTVNNVDPVASIDAVFDSLTGLSIEYVNGDGSVVPGDLNVLVTTSAFTVSGSYSDIGTLDTHIAGIDWDDGSTEGLSITTPYTTDDIEHAYASDAAPGSYTVVQTVIDDDTGTDVATATIQVVDAHGALENGLDSLQAIINTGALEDAANDALIEALAKITGNPDGDADGDGDGDAENGALDHIEEGDLNAAMIKIIAAVELLREAESADPGFDSDPYVVQLVLTGRSITENAIEVAAALPPSKSNSRKIKQAEKLLIAGDNALGMGDDEEALQYYKDAVKKVGGII